MFSNCNMNDITADISKLELLADSEAKRALRECGTVYKNAVNTSANSGDKFKNIGKGARVSVKKSKQGTGHYLIVKGAKGYASLWHLANNGWVHNKSGKKIQGNHFVDRAELMSADKVDAIIDTAVKNLVKD